MLQSSLHIKTLDLLFTAHPITGDVATKSDSDAVRRSVRNIVMTNYYERPFKPSLGGNVRGLLFELDTDRKLNRAKKDLQRQLKTLNLELKMLDVYSIQKVTV